MLPKVHRRGRVGVKKNFFVMNVLMFMRSNNIIREEVELGTRLRAIPRDFGEFEIKAISRHLFYGNY